MSSTVRLRGVALYPLGVYTKAMKKDVQKKLLTRLARIEGQVRGLRKMVEEEEYCVDVITQSHAVRGSLASFESLMLKNHLDTHVTEQIKNGEVEKASREIVSIYDISNNRSKVV